MFYHLSKKGDIGKEIDKALSDRILQHNLKTFFSTYKESRAKAFEDIDFSSLRKEIGSIKNLSREEISNLFEKFKANVEKTGALVYQAKSSKDAVEYIINICKKHNSEYVVKSKSMTAEEIELNKYLISNGITPVETDLGEWIIQLAEEKPSHMIMPAIHKNRQQVAKLLKPYSGAPVDENDIEKMVKIARKYLRNFYFKAKVGITGANIAIAETGTVAILTNEGNGRLTYTTPPVHIVILGYDKLVRNFEDALKILRILPKNATGQIISVYVSWIKGSIDSMSSLSGRKEIHYVFLDNGRLSLFENPLVRESLKCIRCGACANVCPVYGAVGGHVLGYIYTGPIGVILTTLYHHKDTKKVKSLLTMCTGCKACSEVCSANIDIQKIIYELNSGEVKQNGLEPVKKVIFSKVLSKPLNSKSVAILSSAITKPLTKNSYLKDVLIPKKHRFRVLPSPKKESFSQLFRHNTFKVKTPIKKVMFYPGCAIEYLYPDIGISMVKILQKLNIEIDIPEKTVCCGLPAIHSGDKEGALRTIINNIKYMQDPFTYDAYIFLCPTCASTVKNHFKDILKELPSEYIKASEIAPKVEMFSEFINKIGKRVSLKNSVKITYHIPCHQSRGLGLYAEAILKELFKDNFIPLPDADVCCGFGGSFSVEYPSISSSILNKKIETILSTGVDIVLTECPGCLMQIEGGIIKRKLHIKVMHIAEFLDNYVELN